MQNDMTKEKLAEALDWFNAFCGDANPSGPPIIAIRFALDAAIAATEVDVEALRKPASNKFEGMTVAESIQARLNAEWNACIDHLASLGLLRTADTGGWQAGVDDAKAAIAKHIRDMACYFDKFECYSEKYASSHGRESLSPDQIAEAITEIEVEPAAPTHPEVSNVE